MEVGSLSVPVTADLGPLERELARLRRLLGENETSARSVTKAMEGVERQTGSLTASIRRLGIAFVSAFGARAAFQSTVGAFANFETALIGVGKTSDITGPALSELGKQVQVISREVPIATNELLNIAQAAGQLGVKGNDNILRFTKTVGQLGLASNLSGEAAATSLARILTVSGTAIGDVDRLGSTIVRLGNNFAATESEIADAATRVAQATAQFGVSAADIAGISTALRAVGVEAENGGSSVGRAMQAINDAVRNGGKELRNLEAITGETGESLKTLFTTDPTAAFQKLVEGLGRISKAGGDVTAALDTLGLSDIRLIQVLGTLAVRSEVLNDALVTANDEWKTNTALTNEAATAGRSFTSQVTLMFNAITELGVAIGESISPSLIPLVNSIADAFTGMADNIDTVLVVLGRLATYVATGVAGWAAYTAAIYATNLASITLTGTLAFLRVALIRIGIGAVIVAAGELIYQFLKLSERAGGFGNALKLLGNVAVDVWDGIATSAGLIPTALSGVWNDIRADFTLLIRDLGAEWNKFLEIFEGPALTIGVGGKTFELIGGLDLSEWKADLGSATTSAARLRGEAAKLRNEASQLASEGFDKARESLAALNMELGEESNGGRVRYKPGGNDKATPGVPGDDLPKLIGDGKLTKAQREAERLREAYADLIRDSQSFITQQGIEQQALGMTELEAAKLRATFDLLNQAQRAGIKLTPAQAEELKKLAEAMATAEHETRKLQERYDFMKDTFKGFFTDLKTELQNGATIWEAFGTAAANALQKIADKALDMALNGIFDLIFGSLFKGGGFLSGLFKAENGAAFTPGGVTLVGERGPELLKLPGGSQITPNNRVTAPMQASFGGGSGSSTSRVAVDIFVKDDGKIGAIARREAGAVVEVAIHDYDSNQLPNSVERVSNHPRMR